MLIKRKVDLLFGTIFILLAMLATALIMVTNDTYRMSLQQNQQFTPVFDLTKELQLHIIQIQQWLTDISATRGMDGLNDGFDKAEQHYQQAKATLVQLEKYDIIENANVGRLAGDLESYYKSGQLMAKKYIDEGPSGGNKFMASFDAAAEQMYQGLNSLLERTQAQKDNINQLVLANIGRLEMLVIFASIVLLAVVVLIVCFMRIVLFRRLAQFIINLDNLASGNINLNTRMNDSRHDELGQVSTLFNKLIDKITGVIKNVVENITNISGISDQLDDIAKTNVQNIDSQNDSINMIATSMEQLSSNSNEVKHNVEQTRSLVIRSTESLHAGISSVDQTQSDITTLAQRIEKASQLIEQLSEHTNKIASVTNVITDIADQTNLLALNAAIEAARAGEQGRGFAVVADEVRTLAIRTQESTEEINRIINELQQMSHSSRETMVSCSEQAVETVNQANSAKHNISSVDEAMLGLKEQAENVTSAMLQQVAVIEENSTLANQVMDLSSANQTAIKNLMQKIIELNDCAQALEITTKSF